MKKNILSIAIILALSIMLSSCVFDESAQGASSTPVANIPSPSPSVEAAIQISAKDLLNAYDENKLNADNQYKDKLLEVTGFVDDIGTDVLDDVYVTLGDGDEFSFTTVQCYFKDKEEIDKVATLKSGDEITIIGKCDGQFFNVDLKDCKIK